MTKPATLNYTYDTTVPFGIVSIGYYRLKERTHIKNHKPKQCSIDIFQLVRSIQASIVGKLTKEATTMGLSSTQMLVLYEIYDHPNMTLQELCNSLGLPKSTVSRLIDNLVERTYVDREIPKDNRRTVRLQISKKFASSGTCLLAKEKLMSQMDSEKKDRIIAALSELQAALQDQ